MQLLDLGRRVRALETDLAFVRAQQTADRTATRHALDLLVADIAALRYDSAGASDPRSCWPLRAELGGLRFDDRYPALTPDGLCLPYQSSSEHALCPSATRPCAPRQPSATAETKRSQDDSEVFLGLEALDPASAIPTDTRDTDHLRRALGYEPRPEFQYLFTGQAPHSNSSPSRTTHSNNSKLTLPESSAQSATLFASGEDPVASDSSNSQATRDRTRTSTSLQDGASAKILREPSPPPVTTVSGKDFFPKSTVALTPALPALPTESKPARFANRPVPSFGLGLGVESNGPDHCAEKDGLCRLLHVEANDFVKQHAPTQQRSPDTNQKPPAEASTTPQGTMKQRKPSKSMSRAEHIRTKSLEIVQRRNGAKIQSPGGLSAPKEDEVLPQNRKVKAPNASSFVAWPLINAQAMAQGLNHNSDVSPSYARDLDRETANEHIERGPEHKLNQGLDGAGGNRARVTNCSGTSKAKPVLCPPPARHARSAQAPATMPQGQLPFRLPSAKAALTPDESSPSLASQRRKVHYTDLDDSDRESRGGVWPDEDLQY